MSEQGHGRGGWQLERSGPDAYERYLVPSMFASRADRLVDRVGLRTGDRVLDVGCGTGIVARRAVRRVGDEGAVIGLDVNEAMLEVAEATARADGLAIEWRQGDATDLPFPDKRFDAVFGQQVLQFVPDAVAALGEIRRVLTPGGRIGVSVWRPLEFNPGYVELSRSLGRHVGDDAEAMMRSPFPSWDGDDLRALARDAGFADPAITIDVGSVRYPSAAEFVRREAASSPSSDVLDDLDPASRDALVQAVADSLREYTDDEGVVFPMEAFVLTSNRED